MKYLALLRGINVGGNNVIKKDELKSCFEKAGCQSVITYIQSGNILFNSSQTSKEVLKERIQAQLLEKLKNEIQLVVFTEQEYLKILTSCPKGWGSDKEQKHNALFLLNAISTKEAKELLPKTIKEHEQLKIIEGAVFWSVSKNQYPKTSYAKDLAKSPIYKLVTIRNSNTCFKLKDLFKNLEP